MHEPGVAHLQIHGAHFYVRQWPGQGLPIILLHDSLGAVSLWRDFPAQLAAHTGHPVIAYDRLGFGQSDPHPGRLGLDFIAQETEASLRPLLDALELPQAILFGHSVGGGMAISAAARMPDRIAAVITESAQAFVEDRTVQGIRAAQASFADPAQVARLARYHGDDPARAQWVLDAWIDNWLDPAFADWSLDQDLRAVRCPVLALHGDQDEYGSAAHPRRIAGEGMAGRERVMLTGCGHVPHREQPDQVLAAVETFLRRHIAAA